MANFRNADLIIFKHMLRLTWWFRSIAAKNAAIANTAFYATVQPAKLNNLDVVKYLELIFEAYTRSQNLDLKAYLPWNPTVQRICGK